MLCYQQRTQTRTVGGTTVCQLQPSDLTPASLLNGPQANCNNRLRLPAALNFNLNLCSIELPEEKKKKIAYSNSPCSAKYTQQVCQQNSKAVCFFFFGSSEQSHHVLLPQSCSLVPLMYFPVIGVFLQSISPKCLQQHSAAGALWDRYAYIRQRYEMLNELIGDDS